MESGKSGKKRQKKTEPKVGFQFNAPVTAKNQTFVQGNVDNLNVGQGLSTEDLKKLEALVRPIQEQVQQAAPPAMKNQAEEKVQELQTELSKGQNANAGRLNQIVDGLVALVPGAVSALGSMFASPILAGLVGPATKLVLHHLKR
jgi:hypothetical protein